MLTPKCLSWLIIYTCQLNTAQQDMLSAALDASKTSLSRLIAIQNEVARAIEREKTQIERLTFSVDKAMRDEAYYRSLIEPLLRPSPPVRLSVVRAQGGVRLSWPGWQSGYRIETSSDLSGRLWSSNDIRPTISNSQYNLTLSNSHAAQFFRLAKP